MGAFLGQFGEAAAHLPRVLVRLDEAALAANKGRWIWQISHTVRPEIREDVRAEHVLLPRGIQQRNVYAEFGKGGPGIAAPR